MGCTEGVLMSAGLIEDVFNVEGEFVDNIRQFGFIDVIDISSLEAAGIKPGDSNLSVSIRF